MSGAKVIVFVGWLSDPIFAEALLLGFFELRGDLFDAKVVSFFVRQSLAMAVESAQGLRSFG
jgi:hypothetical protein